MRLSMITAAACLQASIARAQTKYADNQVSVTKDTPSVATNFPRLDDIKLYSPAFMDKDSVPAGFQNGTSGPTDQATMGQ